MTILNFYKYSASILFSLFFAFGVNAHALFPDDVIEYITKNPEITDEELSAYFEVNHNMTLEEFYENNPFEEDPDAYDPWFDESDEYKQISRKLDLQALDKEIEALEIQEDKTDVLQEALEREKELLFAISEYDIQQLTLEPFQESFTLNALKISIFDVGIWETVKMFIPDGIRHVLFGWDHILFILSLLFLTLSFKRFLILVSMFTLAHSITLILASFEIIALSSKLVESVIAISIMYACITGIWLQHIPFFQNFRNHLIIVFFFGLFHGLGFAGAFDQLSIESSGSIIALLSLNIGVEIAQLFILSVFFVPFWILKNNNPWGMRILKVFSVCFILVALYWFLDRAYEIDILGMMQGD